MRLQATIVLLLCQTTGVLCHPGHFWHLTDVHWDPTYRTTRESCNLEKQKLLSPLGDYDCDSPTLLMESAIKAMKHIWAHPDFIIWTGDNVYHPMRGRSTMTAERSLELTINASRLLREAFPDIAVFFSIGNHDFFPANQLPATANSVYERLAELWPEIFERDPAQKELFRKGAYYSFLARNVTGEKLRIVSLNTNLYYAKNAATRGLPDPAHQFRWFDDSMAQSRRNGEKVYIISHIPVGNVASKRNRWMALDSNQRLVDLIIKHSDVIAAMFSAHRHTDTFRLFYNEQSGKPVGFMLLSPSVTPWRSRLGDGKFTAAHNPALRLYKYDRHKFGIENAIQYYMNLGQAENPDTTSWKQEYNMTHAYDMANITADSLHGLVTSFKDDNSVYFPKYLSYHTVSTDHPSVTSCDDACKALHVCAITRVRYPDFQRCESAIYTSGASRHCCNLLSVVLFALLYISVFYKA